MTGIVVRSEETRDGVAIREITYAAFLNHPHHPAGAFPTEHKIVDGLRDAGALTLSLVAEDSGEIVGHVAFSPVLVNGEDMGWYGLGPVSVRPDRQRQGIGTALIKAGLRQLEESGAAGVVLVGDPNYYERFGFRSRPELQLEGVPSEYVLSLPIAGDVPSGSVTFHEAFGIR
ncbi:MAG TPA: N-acetyltransferase [Armatimonadota bacterium]|jgi:putative acetyltransferase